METEMTPLPWKKMLILCIVILSEPISMTMLFPFVYFMVKDFGVEESEIGYCVGFIASAFSCAQFVTAYFWGKLSDKYGRRPILLAGLLGNTATMLAFGCSKSLAWAITSRALCGLLNGNVGVAKCVLGEISDKTNRHRAFALIGFNFGLGMIIGPILGGLLDHPTRFALFAGSAFLSKYPYFLPCFVGAMISFTGFVVGWFFLPETSGLAVPEIQTAELVNETTGLLDPSVNSLLEENYLGTFEESTTTRSPPIKSGSMGAAAISSAIAYGLLAFQNIIFMEVFPLWAVATPGIGLGYSSSDIGLCLAGIGIFSLLCQLLIYPKLAATITPLHMFQYSALGMVFFFALVPLASSIFAVNPRLSKLTGVYIAASLAFKTIMENFLFTSLMLLINDSAREGQLGKVNGVAQGFAAFGRSVGPALGGICWAWSLKLHGNYPANHLFIFFLEVCIAAILATHSFTFLARR